MADRCQKDLTWPIVAKITTSLTDTLNGIFCIISRYIPRVWMEFVFRILCMFCYLQTFNWNSDSNFTCNCIELFLPILWPLSDPSATKLLKNSMICIISVTYPLLWHIGKVNASQWRYMDFFFFNFFLFRKTKPWLGI